MKVDTKKKNCWYWQRLYQFCVVNQVSDIRNHDAGGREKFALKLSEDLGEKKKNAVFGILRMSRKILFLQAPEINWNGECVVFNK